MDTRSLAQPHTNEQELLAAAAAAMRLLQDRQRNTPEEMLDPREPKVLRQLRDAVRTSLGEDWVTGRGRGILRGAPVRDQEEDG
jgi:hypothetical protein